MTTDTAIPWDRLERWRTTAFLVAGVWLLAFVSYNGLQVVTDVEQSSFVNTLTTAPALFLGHLGLLGFHRELRERVPRNARAGAVVAVLAATSALALLTAALVQALLLGGPPADGGPTVLMMVGFLTWLAMMVLTALSYVLFGVASLRTDVHATAVGVVLLGPAAVFAVNLLSPVAVGTSRPMWVVFVISAMQAGAHLAVGLVLRTGVGSTGPTEPAGEVVDG